MNEQGSLTADEARDLRAPSSRPLESYFHPGSRRTLGCCMRVRMK